MRPIEITCIKLREEKTFNIERDSFCVSSYAAIYFEDVKVAEAIMGNFDLFCVCALRGRREKNFCSSIKTVYARLNANPNNPNDILLCCFH